MPAWPLGAGLVSPILLMSVLSPGGRSVCWVLRCHSSLPPRTPWALVSRPPHALASAASWMLPDHVLGRAQGPPLWDPVHCCPQVSVFSWGGSVPPRPSICDRSTLSGFGGRRHGGQGCPQALGLGATLGQVERNRLCALSGPLPVPGWSAGRGAGGSLGTSLELELQAVPARQPGRLGPCPSPGPSRKVCPGPALPDLPGVPGPSSRRYWAVCCFRVAPSRDLTTSD